MGNGSGSEAPTPATRPSPAPSRLHAAAQYFLRGKSDARSSVVVAVIVVRLEQVEAEVAPRVVPDGVDVVGVVLGVVVLDQQRGTVEAIVVRLARLERPRPREADQLRPRPGAAGPPPLRG